MIFNINEKCLICVLRRLKLRAYDEVRKSVAPLTLKQSSRDYCLLVQSESQKDGSRQFASACSTFPSYNST